MRGTLKILSVTILVAAIAGYAYAGEHPEHPTAAKGPSISKEDLAEAIEAYIAKDAALKGGYFLVYDEAAGKPLTLTLEKVHKDRLSPVGDGVYFACADFVTPEGKLYDLDVFMKGPDKDHLEVTEISIHKEAGEPRYTWYESGGIWKKKSVSAGTSTIEHPAKHSEGSQMKGSEME